MSSDSEQMPLIRLRDVVKHFESGNVTAVNHVTLDIHRGEYVVIMGPSGSGKSTLLNILGTLDTATSGEVLFEGKSLAELPSLDRFRSQKIGFVFQAFHLLPTLTAIENVQVPMFVGSLSPRQRAARAAELLQSVGMGHRMKTLPNVLSIGERQRVALARALANNPILLLADEPTGNLDTKNGEEILELFDRLHREQKMTLVIITHSPEVGQRAGRIVRIVDGKTDSA